MQVQHEQGMVPQGLGGHWVACKSYWPAQGLGLQKVLGKGVWTLLAKYLYKQQLATCAVNGACRAGWIPLLQLLFLDMSMVGFVWGHKSANFC